MKILLVAATLLSSTLSANAVSRGYACYGAGNAYVGTFADPQSGLNCIML